VTNWGAAARSKQQNPNPTQAAPSGPPVGSRARAQAYRGGANPLGGADGVPGHWGGGGGGSGSGQGGGAQGGAGAKNDNGRRNYNKPWLAQEKEKK
jgi:hypothetical protein